jgi:hypothetical protein
MYESIWQRGSDLASPHLNEREVSKMDPSSFIEPVCVPSITASRSSGRILVGKIEISIHMNPGTCEKVAENSALRRLFSGPFPPQRNHHVSPLGMGTVNLPELTVKSDP